MLLLMQHNTLCGRPSYCLGTHPSSCRHMPCERHPQWNQGLSLAGGTVICEWWMSTNHLLTVLNVQNSTVRSVFLVNLIIHWTRYFILLTTKSRHGPCSIKPLTRFLPTFQPFQFTTKLLSSQQKSLQNSQFSKIFYNNMPYIALIHPKIAIVLQPF